MADTGFPRVPLDAVDWKQWIRTAGGVINSLRDGKINARGEVTLAASTTTTTLSDDRIGPNSVIVLMPTTANASAEYGNGTIYVSARGKGSATITHASNSQTDRTYGYAVLG